MLPHIRHGADNHRRQRPLQMQRQHPAPRIENVFIQDYTVEQYFQSYQLPFTIEDIDRFAVLEQDWPLDELPDDVEDRGGLRLAVWRETRPTPHTHWEQIALRLPIITNVPGAREYFVKNARVQNELREGATTSRCPECGSQLGGFPVPDHSCKVCPFSPLKNTDRLEFMASNLIAYCNACNSRSASHNECRRNVCRRCEDSNHTLAQDLCNWHIGTNAGFQEQLDNVEQHRIRRLELIDRLIHQPTQPLLYFSYLDEPPFNAIRRTRPGSDIYGWGPLLDYPARFDQPVNRNIYGNSLEGKRTEYPSLVPPEYDNNPQVPIPRFSEADREYLNRVADAVTALRENYEAYHHIEVPQLPPRGGRPDEEHQRADDGHHAPMPQVEPAPPQRPLRLPEAAPQHAQLPGPPPVEVPPPKLVWEDGTIIVLEPVVNQATEPRAQHGRIDGANQRPRALPEQRPIQVRQANRPLPPPVEARRQITPVVNVAEQVPLAPIVPPVERPNPTDRSPSTNGNTTQRPLTWNATALPESRQDTTAPLNTQETALTSAEHLEYNREEALSQRVRSMCGQPIMIGRQAVRQHTQLRALDHLVNQTAPTSHSAIVLRIRTMQHVLTGSEDYRYKIHDRYSIESLREYLDALVTAGAATRLEPILLVRLEVLRADPVIEKFTQRGDILVIPSATVYIDTPAIRNIMDEYMITGGARGAERRFENFSPTAHELLDSPAQTDKVSPREYLQKQEEHRFASLMVTEPLEPINGYEKMSLLRALSLQPPTFGSCFNLRINWMSKLLTAHTLTTPPEDVETSELLDRSNYLKLLYAAGDHLITAMDRKKRHNVVVHHCFERLVAHSANGHDFVLPSLTLFCKASYLRWVVWLKNVWTVLLTDEEEIAPCNCTTFQEMH